MPEWIRTRWLVGWLFGAIAVGGCAADPTEGASGVRIDLELADGSQIDEVSYSITGNDMPEMSGTINTSASGSTASIEIYGIPSGIP